MSARLFVYTYLQGELTLAGVYWRSGGLGYFSYESTYLRREGCYPLDPVNLKLSSNVYTTAADDGHFGVLQDAFAANWGRMVLMAMDARRVVADYYKKDSRLPPADFDIRNPLHLMAMGSGFGSGALRFGLSDTLGKNELEPLTSFRRLGVYSLRNARRLGIILAAVEDGRELPPRAGTLLVPGLSLGGARPKCLVHDGQDLWIAKYSRLREVPDIPRAERWANLAAQKIGINCAEHSHLDFTVHGKRRTVFLSRRFDRDDVANPIHFVSAGSLLRVSHQRSGPILPFSGTRTKVGYPDIAWLVRVHSEEPECDLEELYRRLVFNVAIGIRDDHAFNHGFLLNPVTLRYRLSPAYDLALDPHFLGTPNHAIRISKDSQEPSLAVLRDAGNAFGFTSLKTNRLISSVLDQQRCIDDCGAEVTIEDRDWRWIKRLRPLL